MFTLYVENEPWQKMSALAKQCTHEVSGLMEVLLDDDGDVIITDVALLKQNGTSASTHLDMDAVIAFYAEDAARRAKGKNATHQTNYLGWFHSHPGSGIPSYSSVDHSTLKDLAAATKGAERPLFVGLVLDSKGEGARGYLRMAAPVNLSLEGEVKILPHKGKDIEAWAKKELDEKVEKKSYTSGPVRQTRTEALTQYALNSLAKGDDFWNGCEGVSYKFNKELNLFLPKPQDGWSWVNGVHTQRSSENMMPLPILRWWNGKAWALMLRPNKLGHVRVTKAEKKAREVLTEVTPLGKHYLSPYPGSVASCINCDVPSFETVSGKVLCMKCERFDINCKCEEESLSGLIAMYEERLAPQLTLPSDTADEDKGSLINIHEMTEEEILAAFGQGV